MLTASIVLYKNDKKILLESIHSLLNSDIKDDYYLYLVDNSPTDELKNLISHPKVEYIFNPSNPGIS